MSNISIIASKDGIDVLGANYISIDIKGVPVSLNIPIELSKKEDLVRITHFFKEFGNDEGFDNGEVKITYFQVLLV